MDSNNFMDNSVSVQACDSMSKHVAKSSFEEVNFMILPNWLHGIV